MIREDKSNIISIPLLIVVFAQIVLACVNPFLLSDRINYWMFVLNYVIAFLVIAELIYLGLSTHFLAIAFFACYMLFLMGQKPFKPEHDVYLTFVWLKLNTEQYFTFVCILFIGLLFGFAAYLFFFQRGERRKGRPAVRAASGFEGYSLQRVLMVLLLLTLPCALYMQAKIVWVKGGMAYTTGYLVNVDIPTIIKAANYIYSSVVLLVLALKPSKRSLFFILGTLLVIEGGLQMMQGRRALFGSTLFFIVWYLFKYYGIQKIGVKNLVRFGSLAFAMVFLFFIVEQVRSSGNTKLSLDFVKRFLSSTGGSDSVIAHTIVKKNDFPASGFAYLVNPLINNPLGNLLLGKTSAAQGLENLAQHNSFSHWISYLTSPSLYLSGHGMGSCYLAEAYLAFGLVGVGLGAAFVGWGLSALNRAGFTDNIFRTAFVFYCVKHVFSLPRDGFFSWAGDLLYLAFTFMILYPFYAYGRPGTIAFLRRKEFVQK